MNRKIVALVLGSFVSVGFGQPEHDPLADWSGDNIINTSDYIAFLNDWNNENPSCDLNENGKIDTNDLVLWQNCYNGTRIDDEFDAVQIYFPADGIRDPLPNLKPWDYVNGFVWDSYNIADPSEVLQGDTGWSGYEEITGWNTGDDWGNLTLPANGFRFKTAYNNWYLTSMSFSPHYDSSFSWPLGIYYKSGSNYFIIPDELWYIWETDPGWVFEETYPGDTGEETLQITTNHNIRITMTPDITLQVDNGDPRSDTGHTNNAATEPPEIYLSTSYTDYVIVGIHIDYYDQWNSRQTNEENWEDTSPLIRDLNKPPDWSVTPPSYVIPTDEDPFIIDPGDEDLEIVPVDDGPGHIFYPNTPHYDDPFGLLPIIYEDGEAEDDPASNTCNYTNPYAGIPVVNPKYCLRFVPANKRWLKKKGIMPGIIIRRGGRSCVYYCK